MKLQAQKKPCIGYSRHLMISWRIGVISPTRKLNAQFVAVDIDTPFARKVRGMICKSKMINMINMRKNRRLQLTSGGYNQGKGPQL